MSQDEEDNVKRLSEIKEYKSQNLIKPEVEWRYDGWIQIDMTIPEQEDYAQAATIEICKKNGPRRDTSYR